MPITTPRAAGSLSFPWVPRIQPLLDRDCDASFSNEAQRGQVEKSLTAIIRFLRIPLRAEQTPGKWIATSQQRRLSWGCGNSLNLKGARSGCCAPRDDGKRFIVRADEKLTAFLELERAVCIYLRN